MRFALPCAWCVVLLFATRSALADSLHSSTFNAGLVVIETDDASAQAIGSDGTIARAAAFDLDGTLYTTVNSGRHLGTFDLATGAVTVVGPLLPFGSVAMDAIEIDATGTLYGVTTLGQAYRIDKATGAPTLLSSVGVANIRDLAYDPAGTLWAVADNRLHVIDVLSGASLLVGTIGGDRSGNVFGIAFDAQGRLWATATSANAPLYEIDLDTLAAWRVGFTGIDFPRGCDIYVPPVGEDPPAVADADGDGVPDDEDAFPHSDLRTTVHVGWVDTGVHNVLFEDGATIADLVADCALGAETPGLFVERVAHLLVALRKEGWISGADQGRIQRAAAAQRPDVATAGR